MKLSITHQEKYSRGKLLLRTLFGYFYIGKGIFGIAAILLIIGFWATTGLMYLVHTYIVMNTIMAIDMFIRNSRNKKKTAGTIDVKDEDPAGYGTDH